MTGSIDPDVQAELNRIDTGLAGLTSRVVALEAVPPPEIPTQPVDGWEGSPLHELILSSHAGDEFPLHNVPADKVARWNSVMTDFDNVIAEGPFGNGWRKHRAGYQELRDAKISRCRADGIKIEYTDAVVERIYFEGFREIFGTGAHPDAAQVSFNGSRLRLRDSVLNLVSSDGRHGQGLKTGDGNNAECEFSGIAMVGGYPLLTFDDSTLLDDIWIFGVRAKQPNSTWGWGDQARTMAGKWMNDHAIGRRYPKFNVHVVLEDGSIHELAQDGSTKKVAA